MRVLHVIDHLGPGGAQTLLLALAREQRRTGVDARVLSLHGPGANTPAFSAAGVPAGRAASSRLSPFIPVALVRAVRRLRPDFVHAHLVVSSGLCEWLRPAFPRGTRVVCHLHNLHAAHGEDKYQDFAEHLVYRRCDLAVCCGRSVARSLRSRPGGCRVPIAVLPNAIDADLLRDRDPVVRREVRAELGLPEDARVLACVGRLVMQKNLGYAVEVARRLMALAPDSRLLIVGDGPERPALHAQASAPDLAHVVRLLGHRGDVPRILQAADILLLTSREEGFPMVALEAAAAGVPTAATPFASAREVVRPGMTGFTIPFDDPDRAAGVLAAALSDGASLARMGTAARDFVRAHHTIPVLARRLRAAYDRLLP